MMTNDTELNDSPPKQWLTTMTDAGDGSGDVIINFPDDLLAIIGWVEGDVLSFEIIDNYIKVSKSNNP